MSTDSPLQREAEERVAAWIASVDRVPPDGFTKVTRFEEIPAEVCADSYSWCDSIFAPELSPHNESLAPRHAYHLATEDTPDLLRHEYRAGDLDVDVTESRNFVLIRMSHASCDPLALEGSARAAAIRRIAEKLFSQDAGPVFAVQSTRGGACVPLGALATLGEGAVVPSDASMDPAMLACWSDRAECGVRGGCLYFLCYKKPSQRAGYANARQWFDDAFRKGR